MPVLSVSRKLRRANACFVHWWIEQFLLDTNLGGKAAFVLASSGGAADPTSDFEPLRKARKHAATVFCDHDYVFQAHATQSGIVQSGLNRQYLSSFQRNFLQARMLVDLQP